jgi:hypothetical protein
MLSGKSLTEKIREILFENACDMIHENNDYREIKGKNYCGAISTEFQCFSLGGASGVMFEATVEYSSKKTTVTYIVRSSDYEHFSESKWYSGVLIEQNNLKQHELNRYENN